MNTIRTILHFVFPLLSLTFIGCTTVRYYPANFVESLKHPTKFPEVYSSTVKNIEDLAEKNPLGKGEEVKITDVGENKNSSMHLVQVRENGELRPHYHKRHDEVVYVKREVVLPLLMALDIWRNQVLSYRFRRRQCTSSSIRVASPL